MFLSNNKMNIWTFVFYKKSVREKVCYLLLGGRMEIIFGRF